MATATVILNHFIAKENDHRRSVSVPLKCDALLQFKHFESENSNSSRFQFDAISLSLSLFSHFTWCWWFQLFVGLFARQINKQIAFAIGALYTDTIFAKTTKTFLSIPLLFRSERTFSRHSDIQKCQTFLGAFLLFCCCCKIVFHNSDFCYLNLNRQKNKVD